LPFATGAEEASVDDKDEVKSEVEQPEDTENPPKVGALFVESEVVPSLRNLSRRASRRFELPPPREEALEGAGAVEVDDALDRKRHKRERKSTAPRIRIGKTTALKNSRNQASLIELHD
jgi:hypothetical protein